MRVNRTGDVRVSTSPRIAQLGEAPSAASAPRRDCRRQGISRSIVERATEIAEHAQRILTRRLGHQSCDRSLIADEHHFFLIAFERVENGPDVPRDVRHRASLHAVSLSDCI
jgi:hypothetical protein